MAQFQKIFAVSLPSRSDHRDALTLASSLTGLQIDFMDGILASDIDKKTLPPGAEKFTTKGALGAWRAHMNVMRRYSFVVHSLKNLLRDVRIIEENITTALIMEDDVDWDIRIHSQVERFAKASRLLLQPKVLASAAFETPRDFSDTDSISIEPASSPFGDIDNWDVLWLGHCGAKFPRPEDKLPLQRAVMFNDETVPEKQHLDPQLGDNQLTDGYPDHTRVVSHASRNTCTLAYAVSLPGAKRIFYELAVRRIDVAMDLALHDLCDGTGGRTRPLTCLTVLPQLVQQHHPIAAKSSLSDIEKRHGELEVRGEDYTAMAFSINLRWSTRMNFEQLVYGGTEYTDLFMDGMPRPRLDF